MFYVIRNISLMLKDVTQTKNGISITSDVSAKIQ